MEVINRKTVEFEDFGRFRIESRKFTKQYYEIYQARLSLLKQKIEERSKEKWSNLHLFLNFCTFLEKIAT